MKKILNVNAIPILTTYPQYGNLFSMLNMEDPLVWDWITGNFIHLAHLYINDEEKFFPTFPELYTMKQSTPFLKCYDIPYEICHHKSPVAAIKEYIDYGYYVVSFLEQFYISASDAYHKWHAQHLTFFYGYDDEKEIFYVRDNYKSGKYLDAECLFDGVDSAFFESPEHFFSIWQKTEPLWYEFKLDYLIRELKLYAHSYELNKNDDTRYNLVRFYDTQRREDFDYDMGIYRYLKQIDRMERQTYYLVYEHKRLFRMRVAHLCKKGYRISENTILMYEQLERISKMICYLFLKMKLQEDELKTRTKNKMVLYLDEMEELERRAIMALIDDLENKNKS